MKPTGFSYITLSKPREDSSPAGLGGVIERFTAGATLLTGDVVFISAVNTVNKSGTAANYAALAGVVVGGQATVGNVVETPGVTAATVGQSVLVQVSGVANVVAGGTVTVGTHLSVIGDSTAGRVIAGTTAGVIIGTPISNGAAAGTMKILISQR